MNDEKSFVSSTVQHGAYNKESSVLTITFNGGKKYEYYNVPEVVWQQAKEAESIGRYVGTCIKGVYNYKGL